MGLAVELEGVVSHVVGPYEINGNFVTDLYVVVDYDKQYPQTIKVQFWNTKSDTVQHFVGGEVVKVKANLIGSKGHEHRNGIGGEKDRPDLGREVQAAVLLHIIERLHAHPVAGDEKRSVALVPDREREHAAQSLEQALESPGLKTVRQHLGVRAAAKPVSRRLEFLPKFGMVIDLAVVDGPDRAVLARDGLVSAGDIHYGEPSDAERDILAEICSPLVGAAVL